MKTHLDSEGLTLRRRVSAAISWTRCPVDVSSIRWRRVGARAALGLFVFSTLSCSSNTRSSNVPNGHRNAEESSAAPLPPLRRAAAPPDVVFKARVQQPTKIIDRLMVAAGLPFKTADFFSDSSEDVFGLPLDELDMNGSFEVVLSLNPDATAMPFSAASMSVRSVDSAVRRLRSAKLDPVEGQGGVYYFTYEDAHCAIGRALGSSPSRVVCSPDEQSLTVLSPYALRGLPAEPWTKAAMAFDLDMKPIRSVYGQRARGLKLLASVGARQLHVGEARFDRALTEAAVAMAEEAGDLLADCDRVFGQLDQSERGDLSLDWGVEFGGTTSFTALALKDWGLDMARAPERLLHLPAEVSAAGYSQSVPPERLQKMERIVTDLALGYAVHKGAPAKLLADLELILRESFNFEGTVVSAIGPLGKTTSGGGAPTSSYVLYSVEMPETRVTTLFDSIGRVLSAPIWEEATSGASKWFLFKKTNERVVGRARATVYRWKFELPLPEREAAGSDVFDGAPEFLRSARIEGLEGYLVVSSSGGATWIGVAQDLSVVEGGLKALEAAVSAPVESARLGSVQEFSELWQRPHGTASFLRLGALVPIFGIYLPKEIQEKLATLMWSTPNGGEGAVLTYSGADVVGERVTVRAHYELPAAVVGDAAALLVLLFDEVEKVSSSDE